MNIPLDVLKIVASYLVKPKMKLLDWVLLDEMNWMFLSSNSNAIYLLEKNMDMIDWGILSSNSNAIHLLEKNMDKTDWWELSRNPNAIHLLEQNIDKISWYWLSENPNIFEIDTKQLKLDITEKAKIIDGIIYE